jgi:hypothetical protein
MKKNILYLFTLSVLLMNCNKSTLNLPNPNQPTPTSLTTENGIESFAMGVFERWITNIAGEGTTNLFSIAQQMHSGMGDEDFVPYVNWALRYPANVNAITLPPPYNVTVKNPSGTTQPGILTSENSRAAGEQNAYQYEWDACYFMNAQSNLLLQAISNPALKLSGDAKTKKALLQAWAYWWKGFCYSRIGSIYIAGVVNNAPANGKTDSNFVDHTAIIAEANSNFQKAAAILGGITENGDYDQVFTAIVPSFNLTQIITPAMWIRQIHTYIARNYLVNIKIAAMQPNDWAQVVNEADSGMVSGDVSFMYGMEPGGVNDLSYGLFNPIAFHSNGNAFCWVSERFIQDFQPGDIRFSKNFGPEPGGPVVNLRNRGIQFGTRWNVIDIENGGTYASDQDLGTVSIGATWEENALMIAEAKIRTGSDIDGGLALVDQVRDEQGSGLAHVSGTGLTQAQAAEQLRSERRIALYMRGLAFYDARRWGVTAPAASGGGRANANVLVPGSVIDSSSAVLLPCFIDYDYLDYWDVPQNELDFNNASTTSAPVKNAMPKFLPKDKIDFISPSPINN